MTYLLRLPVRMARAALEVPLRDLDGRLALTPAARFLDEFAAEFAHLKETRP